MALLSHRHETSNSSAHIPVLSVYVIAAIVALGGFLLGYDTGAIAGAEIFLKKDFALNPLTEELAISAVLAGGIVGAAVSGKLSNAIGRKYTIIAVAIFFAIVAILLAFAASLPFFIAFRMLLGVGLGIVTLVVPVYLSEIAPPAKRGALVTYNRLALVLAVPIAYWIDLALSHTSMGWRLMFGVEALPGVVLAIGMFFLPESPRWLANKGRWHEADQVLTRLAGAQHENEMKAIRASLSKRNHASVREFFTSSLCMALIVALGLAIFQQVIGSGAISYYSTTIFRYAGFKATSADFIANTISAIDTIVATILALFLVDRLGRRPLLIGSLIAISVTLVAMGIIFNMHASYTAYLILASLLIYILAYGLGIGPLFSLMCSEIFPLRVRGAGVSIATAVNWAATLLVSVTFLSLINLVGKALTFWIYAILACAGVVFCWFLVPETKGKNLEQIEEYWEHGGL